jgi:hypothetical protein
MTQEHPKSDRLRFWQSDLAFLRRNRRVIRAFGESDYRRDVRLRLERCIAARRAA